MDVDATAPVTARESRDIAASAADVWAVLSDVGRWSCWNPEIRSARLEGPLAPGTLVQWRAGPGAITSVLRVVDPLKELSWTGSTMGIHAVHVWRLESSDGGVRVTTEESWRGWPVRLMRRRSQRTLREAVTSGLDYLKTEAERRACITAGHGVCAHPASAA